MYLEPVADVNHHYSAMAAESARAHANTLHYTAMIRDTLTKHIRVAANPSLPYPKNTGGVGYLPVEDVVTDEVCFGAPLDALMAVMVKSDCPHVAALRKAIADSYISSTVDLIAEAAL